MSVCRLLIASLAVAAWSGLGAAVVRVEVTGRTDLGASGYEEIRGRLHFEVDPGHPGNAVIADLGRAPVNAAGRVAFASDLRLQRAKDAARRNGAAWVEIPNRGGKAGLSAAQMAAGFTLLSVGWEFDVTEPGKLALSAPRALGDDGRPLRGVVHSTFLSDKRVDSFTLTDVPLYPPVDPDGPDSRLIRREHSAFPGGTEVPRTQWRLEPGRLSLQGGLEPGRTYELAYLSEGPPVAGLGYAAIRDAVAWLKHGADSPAPVRHALAFGSSQCGRLLRDFLYLGFNTDEQDRRVFDGVMAHIAGAGRLVLNQRWSQPRSVAAYFTASYPFADTALPDPVSGRCEGVLDNPRVKHAPKLFYLNTASEYWGAGRVAALTHTDAAGTRDAAFPDHVRSYYYAGTQHGPASFPPPVLTGGQVRLNPVNATAVTAALRQALHRWVTEGVPPPASVHPKLSDGTLVPVREVRFPAVPGLASPRALRAGARVPNPLWPEGAGAGAELPLLVPQVDADGNDLTGIRLPDVAVPLGTATGWIFRTAALGQPGEPALLRGAWVPFAATRAQRAAAGDPRLSLEERYAGRDDYLRRVRGVLEDLVRQGFLTGADLEPQLRQAGERWDWVVTQTAR